MKKKYWHLKLTLIINVSSTNFRNGKDDDLICHQSFCHLHRIKLNYSYNWENNSYNSVNYSYNFSWWCLSSVTKYLQTDTKLYSSGSRYIIKNEEESHARPSSSLGNVNVLMWALTSSRPSCRWWCRDPCRLSARAHLAGCRLRRSVWRSWRHCWWQ